MEPVTTASKAVHTARAAGAALSILPSVFTVIQRASQEFSTSLRPVAFYILALYSSSDRHTVLSEERLACYAVVLLDAVEARVREEVLWNSEACTCEQSHKVFYPKSHALSHVADTNLSNVLSFADSFASHDLARILQDTVDELLLDSSNSPTKPARKRRRGPQWGISKYTGRVFHALHAISQCRCGPDGCGLIEHSKTKARLALATYWNVSKEDPFLDVLFALEPLGTETPLWTEFRIHAHSSESTSPDAGTTPAVSRVAFPDKHVRAASTAPVWRMKTPKQIERFCRLLDPSLPHFRSMYRVNLTLDAADDIWQHVPTARFLDQADLSHFTSLGAILAASGMCEFNNDMTKLMLAAILSYSLFYLYEGPWLRARSAVGWDRESIVFFRKDDMVLLRPFLHSDIRGNASDTSHEDGDDDGIGPFIPDPVLLGFGIILLEIHLGRTLESYLNLTQPLTSVLEKLACAWRVFNKRRTYFPWSGYRDAVEACLSPCLERSDGNSESDTDEQTIEQRRGMIFSKIVSPLQDELERRAEFNADGSKSDINLDAFDEQAASMDLFSGHSAADNLTMRQHHHSSIITSTHEQAISYPQKNSLVTAKAIAIPHISSKKPESLLYASDYPEDAEPGKIYNLFADPGVPLSGSLQDHVATDNWFNLFRDLAIVRTLESVEPREPHRVRVAIIDTGIDMGHVDMLAAISNKQIVKVCDWVDGQEGREDKNMRDSSGHGTHVASIILDMAPNVDLYIARVSKGHMISHNQADNVATAIRTASSEWGCAIINISLGFSRGIQSIESALDAANQAGVIVFAAASNDGANSGHSYPAWNSHVACIYSTDGHGNRSPFNPSPDERAASGGAFSIVGQFVSGAWPSDRSQAGASPCTRRMTGTSFATPVAAALAACVLGFASLYCKGKLEKSFIKLASHDGMRRVLTEMVDTNDRHRSYRYLNPFKFFGRGNDEITADIKRALNPTK